MAPWQLSNRLLADRFLGPRFGERALLRRMDARLEVREPFRGARGCVGEVAGVARGHEAPFFAQSGLVLSGCATRGSAGGGSSRET